MKNLSRKDLLSLVSAIETLHSESDPITLPERTLQAVISLIPNEITSFDGFGSDSNYAGYLWYSPAGTVSEERVEVLGKLVHEHPIFQDVVIKQRTETKRVSQYMSLAKFQETALYHEFYKHIGGDSQMLTSFTVSPQLYVTCSLHRLKADFSERDLIVLKALSPHLISAFRNAQIFNRLCEQKTSIADALDTIGYGVLTLDSEMNICDQNLRAVKLLHEYFSDSKKLPEDLLNYLKSCASVFAKGEPYGPPAPLIVKKIDSTLRVRMSPQFQTRSIVIFLEEIRHPCASVLKQLGLTHREAEILFWISKGKSDADIARLSFISIRTVHKHRENIFKKLGIENRTAAATMANDVFNKKFLT